MAKRLLYLTRHGETDWNAAGRWQGLTDIPLNAKGQVQARAVAETLRPVRLAGIVSSDLSRASETARIVAELLGLPIAYFDADLRERAFGPFEGLTREDCARLHPGPWRAWLDERRPPEGAEDRSSFGLRVMAALNRAAQQVARDGGAALVVTHGGSLRAAIAATNGVLPPPIANGAIWRFAWEAGSFANAEPFDSP